MRDDWPNSEGEWDDGIPDEGLPAWNDDADERWSGDAWSEEDWSGESVPAEVPVILRSEYSGKAFETCLVCNADLAEAELHIVEKLIRNGEAVMEMALCGECAEEMSRECSEESLQTIREVQESWAENMGDDAATCAGCGKLHQAGDAFVVAGYFLAGYDLMRSMTVCEACHDAVHRKLSRSTRDRFGEFIRDHFPGVPENMNAPVGFG